MAKLTVTFEVDDDLTSERAADYRETIVAGLIAIGNLDPRAHTVEQHEMADKLLNDVNNT